MLFDLYVCVLAPMSLAFVAVFLVLVLVEPSVAYRIALPAASPNERAYRAQLATLCMATEGGVEAMEVFSRGADIYAAEIAAISAAKHSIHVEAYIFREGKAADQFLDALTERALAGVTVRLTLDGFGNLFVRNRYFQKLRDAGGQIAWYQPVRWYTLKRYNNRTHREIIVIDTRVAFVGGAGIADWWIGDHGKPPWRDTMVRFEGPLVPLLQAVFAENWLGASGDILFGEENFPSVEPAQSQSPSPLGFVVPSTPSEARSTRARLLFQTLVASARTEIRIQTPYFVPDRSARREIVRALERGVRVEVIVPGTWNNHKATRYASRARYGSMLRAGAIIREYQPSMIHTKTLVIDGVICVVGSSNWDNRSASLNDEINLVIASEEMANRLGSDSKTDATQSVVVSYQDWQKRGIIEKIVGLFASVLVRQQ